MAAHRAAARWPTDTLKTPNGCPERMAFVRWIHDAMPGGHPAKAEWAARLDGTKTDYNRGTVEAGVELAHKLGGERAVAMVLEHLGETADPYEWSVFSIQGKESFTLADGSEAETRAVFESLRSAPFAGRLALKKALITERICLYYDVVEELEGQPWALARVCDEARLVNRRRWLEWALTTKIQLSRLTNGCTTTPQIETHLAQLAAAYGMTPEQAEAVRAILLAHTRRLEEGDGPSYHGKGHGGDE